jgi:hypothetical protein
MHQVSQIVSAVVRASRDVSDSPSFIQYQRLHRHILLNEEAPNSSGASVHPVFLQLGNVIPKVFASCWSGLLMAMMPRWALTKPAITNCHARQVRRGRALACRLWAPMVVPQRSRWVLNPAAIVTFPVPATSNVARRCAPRHREALPPTCGPSSSQGLDRARAERPSREQTRYRSAL